MNAKLFTLAAESVFSNYKEVESVLEKMPRAQLVGLFRLGEIAGTVLHTKYKEEFNIDTGNTWNLQANPTVVKPNISVTTELKETDLFS